LRKSRTKAALKIRKGRIKPGSKNQKEQEVTGSLIVKKMGTVFQV
jgi:hypothetical protein